MLKKEKFFQAYANLPLSARKEIVAVIEHEPLSWNAAKIEIVNNTSKAQAILEQIEALEIIK